MRPPRRTPVPWRTIEGLTDPHGLAVPELRAFTRLWQRQRSRMREHGNLEPFEEQLARRWSIETGVIERLYDISRGATDTLVKHGFIASLVAHGEATVDADDLMEILGDHSGGLDMVMDVVAGNHPFSAGWIKELHALLTRHQTHAPGRMQDGRRTEIPLLHGEFKVRPNNPRRPDGLVHEYCPPEHVRSEIDRLLAMFAELPPDLPEVRAAWLHHRFVQIHPFQDGNGRVARAITSFELVRGGLFPFIVERHERDTEYFPALEAADAGDLRPLVEMIGRAMTRCLRAALATRNPVASGSQPAIAAARAKIQARRSVTGVREEMRTRLQRLATEVLTQLESVNQRLVVQLPDMGAVVARHESPRELHAEIMTLADGGNYLPNLREYHVVCTLVLEDSDASDATGAAEVVAEVAIVLHPIVEPALGVAIANILLDHRPLPDIEPLLLPLDEQEQPQSQRLSAWLETALGHAITRWTDTL